MSDENEIPTLSANKEGYKNKFLSFCTAVFSIMFLIFFFVGLSQLFGIRNAPRYVGGDAYNFLIQATKASASLILSFGSLIAGLLIEIINRIDSKR